MRIPTPHPRRSGQSQRAGRHAAARPSSIRTGGLVLCGLLVFGACGADPSSDSRDATEVAASTALRAPSGTAPATSEPAPAADIRGVQVGSSVDGFDRPWDLRFLPDGTPLVTERPGRLAAVVDGQRRVVAEVPGVVAAGEGGLMGMALDPDFAANRQIYLCFAYGTASTVRDVRVVRYALAQGLDAIADPKPVLTGIPAGAGNRHLGCRVEIGPDGMLWIATGDAVIPQAPQNPRSRAGKVLRARLDGRPAPGNRGGTWDPYVYTLGHRNIQGLAFRPGDDTAFAVEHGTNCDDEINLLQVGGNYGWNPVAADGGYAEGAPMTAPDIDGAIQAVWSSGCPTIAPAGGTFITGEQWGQWTGALAVAVLKDRQLLLVGLDGDAVTDTSTELFGVLGRLRTVRNAPEGSLWVTVDDSPGSVVRLQPRS